jgi:hypothetical protein
VIIAHVLSSFGVGGQERVALDLADVLHRRGHQVIAVSLAPPPEGPLADEFRAAGVEVIDVPKGPGHRPDAGAAAGVGAAGDVEGRGGAQPQPAAADLRRAGGAADAARWRSTPSTASTPARAVTACLRRQAARLVSAFVAVSTVTAQQAREQRDCEEAVSWW